MIDRRNIIELIGKNRGKYHSCILTCYSFDFSFFEERMLPELRTANIKNVNVLADGHFLELAQESTTGKEFKHNKTYNFIPVYEKGVFHPKIMLLTGVKHGLLIIGSGNMTSSGLSTNDEIWGAFHLDNLENENAPLFAQVWNYLQHYTKESKGFVNQQIEWITKYSPWLNELPQVEGEIPFDSIGQSIHFVSNKNELSIYEQLVTIVPRGDVQELTVISPYFDKKGSVLKQLLEHYNPIVFNCIVDVNSGLLPSDIDVALANRISFYDWSTCKNDYLQDFNRLHAKVVHFKHKDGTEYIMLGSANATIAAMGSLASKGANAEAGILLKRTRESSNSWIKELRIKLPKTTIQVSTFTKTKGINADAIPRAKLKQRILYSELRGSEITIYVKNDSSFSFNIALVSRQDVLIENLQGVFKDNTLTIQCKYPDDIFKIYLTEDVTGRVSNFSIVHRVEFLMKCNPDPEQEKLETLFDAEYPDGEGVTNLLQYIDYNWADNEDENNITKVNHSAAGFSKKLESQGHLKVYKTLSPEEFNKISNDILLKQTGELSNPNVKIAEFLNLLSAANQNKENDYRDSSEQGLLEDKEQNGKGESVDTSIKKKSIAIKEKRAIAHFYKKLENTYDSKLAEFFDSKVLTLSPVEPITIKTISNILVAFELIKIYQGKKFTFQSDTLNESSLKEELYLYNGTIHSEANSIKGFMVNVFGKFLLLATAGMKDYGYDILNQNLIKKRKQLLVKSIVVILNLKWKNNEEKYKETLLLNCLYFINPEKVINENFCNYLIENLTANEVSNTNLEYFAKVFLLKYKVWFNQFENKEQRRMHLITETNELPLGTLVFSSKIGFNRIVNTENITPPVVGLMREGYPLLNSEYVLDKITLGEKIIQFSVE